MKLWQHIKRMEEKFEQFVKGISLPTGAKIKTSLGKFFTLKKPIKKTGAEPKKDNAYYEELFEPRAKELEILLASQEITIANLQEENAELEQVNDALEVTLAEKEKELLLLKNPPHPIEPLVLGVALFDLETNQPITDLTPGMVLEPGTRSFQAETNEAVLQIAYTLKKGEDVLRSVATISPFVLPAIDLGEGNYSLTVAAQDGNNLTFNFSVVSPPPPPVPVVTEAVVDFDLYDADNDRLIGQLAENQEVNVNLNFAVVAKVTGNLLSLTWELFKDGKSLGKKSEKAAPFTYPANEGTDLKGIKPGPGTYEIVAIPYKKDKTPGVTLRRTFVIKATAKPVPVPETPKTSGKIKAIVDEYLSKIAGTPKAYEGMLFTDQENVKTVSQLEALIKKAKSMNKAVHHEGVIVADKLLDSKMDGVYFLGYGTLADNLPEGYDKEGKTSKTNKQILRISGNDNYWEITLDGRFDNTNFNQWWRGRRNGSSCGKLAEVTGDNFRGKLKLRNAGGTCMQINGKNPVIEEAICSNNGYTSLTFKAPANGTDKLVLLKYYDIKETKQGQACRKSLSFTNTGDDNSKYKDVVLGDLVMLNCTPIAEAVGQVGKTKLVFFIDNIYFSTMYISNESPEMHNGQNVRLSSSHCGKWEGVRNVYGHHITTINKNKKGESFWAHVIGNWEVDKWTTNTTSFRGAAYKNIFGETHFIVDADRTYEAELVRIKSGSYTDLGKLYIDDGGKLVKWKKPFVDLDGESSRTVFKIKEVIKLGKTAPVLVNQGSGQAKLQLGKPLVGINPGKNAKVVVNKLLSF